MIELLKNVLQKTIERITKEISTDAPALLAGLLIVLVAYGLARLARWLLGKIFKGTAFDRFLRQSGLSSMMDRSGGVRAAELVAGAAFWLIFLGGVLTGISAFDTQLTSRITETAVFLAPKLLAAAGIIVAGIWFGRYLGNHLLVWAVNEGIPAGRRFAAAARVLVVFVAITAAADYLGFARNVFLATLILVLGGIVLTASIICGLCGRDYVMRYMQEKPPQTRDNNDIPIWKHL